jgi:hypothetical protein
MFAFASFHLIDFVLKTPNLGSWRNFVLPYAEQALAQRESMLNSVSLMEVTNIILCLLTQSLLVTFAYFNFLRFRYQTDRRTQAAVQQLRLALDTLATHQYCPSLVARLYYSLRDLLSR